MEIVTGQTVLLADGRSAVVRYVGEPEFSDGEWVGVELEDGSGKNNGTVKGVTYFVTAAMHGMFLRPTAISQILSQPTKSTVAAPTRRAGQRPSSGLVTGGAGIGAAGPSRPNLTRPSSVADPMGAKRMSLNAASPTPVARTSRTSSIGMRPGSISPDKRKATASTTPSSAVPSRTATPSNARAASSGPAGTTARGGRPSLGPSAGTRTSMGPPALPRVTRQPSNSSSTTAGPSTSAARGTAVARGGRLSGTGRGGLTRPPSGRVVSGDLSSVASKSVASSKTVLPRSEATSPGSESPIGSRAHALEKLSGGATSTAAASVPGSRVTSTSARPAASNALSRENEDLKAKLKILERKRGEDREKVKELERLQTQGDKSAGILKKIEAKFQTAQQENVSLRKQVKEAEERLESMESLQAEHDSIMELATLDREVAEETADVLKVELDALKQRLEEQELELEILREENAEYDKGVSADDKANLNWIHLERQNERLRDALIRLRDITQEQDEDSKAQIKSLQLETEEHEAIKQQYEIAKEKLLQTESRAEDLREQLDNALGAEDMIEKLTEEKMAQDEVILELKAEMEELEALREISDELEVNHVQNEKEMQEELDFKDAVINEQARRMGQQEENNEDMEYTLSRFRELVTSLQTDLEDMRASHAVNEAESEQLNSKSRQMMDLNLKLQISASKTQVKTVDLELQRMDAQEAQQHLQIVKLFLPESYDADRNSVLALLRFRRLSFKANLLHGFLKERVSSGQPTPGHEDDVFAGCDAVDKLMWVSSMCERFVNAISHCSLEEFSKYEGALFELEPVERALNGWVDGLKRGELREKQCADELSRTIALMSHLAEVHISNNLASFADYVQMETVLMQSHLESAATAFAVIKDMVQHAVPADEENDELAQHFTKKVETAISQTRGAKVVVGKAVRSLEDLKARQLCLTPDTADVFEQCELATQELANMSCQIGRDLHALTAEEGRSEPLKYTDIQNTVHQTIMNAFSANDTDLFSTYLSKLRVLTTQITDLAAICGDLSQTQEFELAHEPWKLRSQELRALKTIPIDTEEELRVLRDQYNESRRTIAARDDSLSTSNLRIETLEARMRDVSAKASRISDLEAQIADAQVKAAKLNDDIEKQDRELKTLEADRDRWKKMAGDGMVPNVDDGTAGSNTNNKAGQERAVATAREMDKLKNDISALQAAVKFLREDNQRARIGDQAKYAWLAEPLRKPTSVQEQRRRLIAAEGRDALSELVKLVTGGNETTARKTFDLTTLGEGDRLKWRPAKETAQWHVARLEEEWAAWREWRGAIVRKAGLVGATDAGDRSRDRAREKGVKRRAAARLKVRLPGSDGKVVVGGGEVRVVRAEEWEGVVGRVVV